MVNRFGQPVAIEPFENHLAFLVESDVLAQVVDLLNRDERRVVGDDETAFVDSLDPDDPGESWVTLLESADADAVQDELDALTINERRNVIRDL